MSEKEDTYESSRAREDMLLLEDVLNASSRRVACSVIATIQNLDFISERSEKLTVNQSVLIEEHEEGCDCVPELEVSLSILVRDVPDIMEWIDNFLHDKEIFSRTYLLYLQITDMLVADALVFISEEYLLENDGDGCTQCISAEISILEGLFYGYEPCCVEYYVDTRYRNQQRYSGDINMVYDERGVYRGVPCPACARTRPVIEEHVSGSE